MTRSRRTSFPKQRGGREGGPVTSVDLREKAKYRVVVEDTLRETGQDWISTHLILV